MAEQQSIEYAKFICRNPQKTDLKSVEIETLVDAIQAILPDTLTDNKLGPICGIVTVASKNAKYETEPIEVLARNEFWHNTIDLRNRLKPLTKCLNDTLDAIDFVVDALRTTPRYSGHATVAIELKNAYGTKGSGIYNVTLPDTTKIDVAYIHSDKDAFFVAAEILNLPQQEVVCTDLNPRIACQAARALTCLRPDNAALNEALSYMHFSTAAILAGRAEDMSRIVSDQRELTRRFGEHSSHYFPQWYEWKRKQEKAERKAQKAEKARRKAAQKEESS